MGATFSDLVGYGFTKEAARDACIAAIRSQGYDITYPLNGDSDKMRISCYGTYSFEYGPLNNGTYASKSVCIGC